MIVRKCFKQKNIHLVTDDFLAKNYFYFENIINIDKGELVLKSCVFGLSKIFHEKEGDVLYPVAIKRREFLDEKLCRSKASLNAHVWASVYKAKPCQKMPQHALQLKNITHFSSYGNNWTL